MSTKIFILLAALGESPGNMVFEADHENTSIAAGETMSGRGTARSDAEPSRYLPKRLDSIDVWMLPQGSGDISRRKGTQVRKWSYSAIIKRHWTVLLDHSQVVWRVVLQRSRKLVARSLCTNTVKWSRFLDSTLGCAPTSHMRFTTAICLLSAQENALMSCVHLQRMSSYENKIKNFDLCAGTEIKVSQVTFRQRLPAIFALPLPVYPHASP